MKRIIALTLVMAMLTAMAVGCGKQEEEPEVVGGWTEEATTEIPEDALEAYNKAMENYTDMELTIKEYLGSQVVAGTNFKFTCVNEATGDEYTVVVYRNLDNNCEVSSVDKN